MAFASRLKNTADRLIDKFGDSFVVTMIRSEDVYDPETQTSSPMAPTTWTLKMVVLAYQAREIDGQNVLASDRKAIVQVHDTYTPRVTDRVDVAGQEYAIVNVLPTQPGATPIFYELQLRGDTDGR